MKRITTGSWYVSHEDGEQQKRAHFECEALPQLDFLYRFALRFTDDRAYAEDLVQETFLKAYRAWHQYEPGTNVRAWLATILRNTFVAERRRESRRRETIEMTAMEPWGGAAQRPNPEVAFFDKIIDDEVLRAVDDLPRQFREPLVLSDIEGLPYDEIAQILATPLGTVKSRIHRARLRLQEKLSAYAVEMGYVAVSSGAVPQAAGV